MKYDVIVIGGGPAGLLAAGTAARRGRRVLVLEKKNRPARKILVTGKGRCNVTNNCDPETFIAAVRTNPYFLYSAYYGFTAQDMMALLEEQGVPLKTERGNRVFPVSDKAMDIADALVQYARKGGAHIRQHTVESLLQEEGKILGVRTAEGEEFLADSVVISTGGKSYPGTGSTGDGYQLAESAGHTIQPLKPSLIPIVTKEKWPERAMGLSLRNVELSVMQSGRKKPVYQEQGEMLFTHFGVSGPLVLSASAHMREEIKEYNLLIDLKPALSEKQLDQRLLRDFEEYSNRDFSNALDKLLPRLLIPIFVELTGMAPDTKVHQITKEQRDWLVYLLKHLPLTPMAFRPLEEAVVTAGGVEVDEVNSTTMESKLVTGLYFAGEVLDLDAYTGGFNLKLHILLVTLPEIMRKGDSTMISVAIDGPSGAGKSTLARAAAKELGYVYVDTGACYRAVALYAMEHGVKPADANRVESLLPHIHLSLAYQEGEQRVLLGQRDVSEAIRTPEVSREVSVVSAQPAVRAWLLDFQRNLAKGQNVLMDGRDIGTVVLPHATVKVFLTASAEERAQRRYKDFLAKGEKIEYNKVLEDMRARDHADSTRPVAPLRQAEDAVLLDTSSLSFEESLARLLEIIKGRA